MQGWILSLALLGASCAQGTTWVLDREVLEARLPAGISVEELIGTLQKEGIDVRFQEAQDRILWSRGRVAVSLSPSPFSPYHLWVYVEGKKTLDECTADELGDLYEGVWRGRKAIAAATGADGFMILTTEQPRVGKGNGWVGVEVIPYGFNGSGGVMDAVEKNALNDYLYANRFFCRNIVHPPETVQAIRDAIGTFRYEVDPDAPQERDWTQKFWHHGRALHQTIQEVYDALGQSGALVRGDRLPLPSDEEGIYEIKIDPDRCAFCNPGVIEKQIVSEWKGLAILMSHKPMSPYGSFVLIPKRHQTSWDLTREEGIALFETIIALKKLTLETTGSNEWISYSQDGLPVGQTVPHTNTHFLLAPPLLRVALTGLQHLRNDRPILSYETMREMCDWNQSILLPHLEARCER